MQKQPFFRIVFVFECRQLLRERSLWIISAILVSMVWIAVGIGAARTVARNRVIAEAKADEEQRLRQQTQKLVAIERGEEKEPDAAYRDPRNALYVGRGSGAAIAYLPTSAASYLSIGISDLYPPAMRITTGSRESFLFVDDVANPLRLLGGELDIEFIISFLFPLMLIALSYDPISGERERGTLAMMLASSAPWQKVIKTKLLTRCGVVTFFMLGSLLVASISMTRVFESREGIFHFAWLVVVVLTYGYLWSQCILWVNSFGKSSTWNAMALLLVWLCFVVLWPIVAMSVSQVLYPSPSRLELVAAAREAAVGVENDRPRAEKELVGENWMLAARNDERTQRTLLTTLASTRRVETLFKEHESQLQHQRDLCYRLAFASPPMLVSYSISELAGNGPSRWSEFLSKVSQFHEEWQSFFVSRSIRNEPLSRGDYDQFPRFDAAACKLNAGEGIVVGLAGTIWILALGLFLGWDAMRRLQAAADRQSKPA
jgi:ABC-2 type transport system permease protein